MLKFEATANGLVEYVKKCKTIPHIYLWDANGQYLTHDLLDSLIYQYDYWYNEERIAVRRSLCNRNIRGWDCIGLIKSYIWNDYTQTNAEYYTIESDLCTRTLMEEEFERGDIKTIPEIPGLVLWRKGHVGVYVGNNQVIECSIRNPITKKPELIGGIIEGELVCEDWSIWLKYPGIKYI